MGFPSLLSRAFFPLLLLIQAAATDLSAASRISHYQAVLIPFYTEEGMLLAATRRYTHGDEHFFLVLDPQRFVLNRMTAVKVLASRPAGDRAWRETSFFQALARQTAPPYPVRNDGLREAESPVKGFFLTADLCPTDKPMDRRFFNATAALPQKQPVPIALAVSGFWMRRHAGDLAWLKEQMTTERISVTWINHSFSHAYDPLTPTDKNFLLLPETDFTGETLSLERLLLEAGLTPSPFFRFPGLVSDQRLIERLRDLCLIPIGSNAWLAKGESPRAGSVILVHANGSEPEGIRRLLSFYEKQRASFLQGAAALLPLREAFLSP